MRRAFIYAYLDHETKEYLYIGQTMRSPEMRMYDRFKPSNYNKSRLNRLLQDNELDIDLVVLHVTNKSKKNKLEEQMIKLHKPKYNIIHNR